MYRTILLKFRHLSTQVDALRVTRHGLEDLRQYLNNEFRRLTLQGTHHQADLNDKWEHKSKGHMEYTQLDPMASQMHNCLTYCLHLLNRQASHMT